MPDAGSGTEKGDGAQTSDIIINGEMILRRMRAASERNSDAALAELLQVRHSTLASWRRRNAIPLKALLFISKTYLVSLEWLILGETNTVSTPIKSTSTANNSSFSKQAIEYGIKIYSILYNIPADQITKIRIGVPISTMMAQERINIIIENEVTDVADINARMDAWIGTMAQTVTKKT